MGEPIQLHSRDGKTLHVYTRVQADALLAGGSWFATAADAEAGKVREEPTPTTAAKLAALEPAVADGGGDVTEGAATPDVTEAPAPTPAPRKASKGRTAKAGKGL